MESGLEQVASAMGLEAAGLLVPGLITGAESLLESTGRFRVRVLEEFRGIGDELLDRFDAVLVMYEGRDDYHSVAEGFGTTTERALLRFVREKGRGIVWFHGSSVQEPDWGWPEEFDRMRGASLSR